MNDAKEEIRSRLNIEDIIGDYVNLKRAGRDFKGLSPFTSEKTPSFYVSPEKNIWHDFSSGKGGDIFSFIMEAEGLSFRQALELLARKAGIDLSVYDNKKYYQLNQKKQRLIQLLNLTTKYYQESLINNPTALKYVFKKRQLTKETVLNFKIGYAPDSGKALVTFLEKRGYSLEEMRQAGLLNRYNEDFFRERMMIPLTDETGNVIGYTGRIITANENSPKYLNTPQTLLYDKGRHVFGLYQAKQAIKSADACVIVEGNMDVISSHQAGVKIAVATAGTAMTEWQIKIISRFTNNIKLSYDGDSAGIKATERAIPLVQNQGVNLSIVSMLGGAKDADELIKKSVDLWEEAIKGSTPAVDWLLNKYKTNFNLSTADGQKGYSDVAIKLIDSLKDEVEKEYYLKQVALLLDIPINTLKDKSARELSSTTEKKLREVKNKSSENKKISYFDRLLELGLIEPLARDVLKTIKVNQIDESQQAVFDYLISHNEKTNDTPNSLQKYDKYVKILLTEAEFRYSEWSSDEKIEETANLVKQIKQANKQHLKTELEKKLQQAENQNDYEQVQLINKQIDQLIKGEKNGSK